MKRSINREGKKREKTRNNSNIRSSIERKNEAPQALMKKKILRNCFKQSGGVKKILKKHFYSR